MFSHNSGQRFPKLSEVHHFWTFDPQGKLVIEFLSSLPKITPSLDETPIEKIQLPWDGPVENIDPQHAPADRFMDANNERLLDFIFSPLNDLCNVKESKGLPPSFVSNFCLNRIFTEPWEDADLTQALTGLDYLANLEYTRRTALREAAQRLRINEDTWQSVLSDNSEATTWVLRMQKEEDEIGLCYSSLWTDLRLWTMSKELLSVPFYKPSVIAMLNTLFPPVIKDLPNRRISDKSLYLHRSSFYRHILAVEKNGKSELEGFIQDLDRPGTDHTWSEVRQNLKDYIARTDSMIKEASEAYGISFFKNVSGEHPALRSTRVSHTKSLHSDSASVSSESTKPSHDELNRSSTKSDENPETENSGSLNTSVVNKELPVSPDSKYILPTRSRISGRRVVQRINSQVEIDTLFQGPRRPSSASGHSLETSHSGGGRRSSTFSRPVDPSIRPLTPSIEQQRVHRRSMSASKRISYDFHNALPGTPELPSPQANEKKNIPENPAASHVTIPSENNALTRDRHPSEAPAAKKKKAGFNMFRRKKKLENSPGPEQTIIIRQDEGSRVNVSVNSGDTKDTTRQTADRLFVPEHLLKKKSSFRFLQRRKSHDDCRTVSDSNSDRTVTGTRDKTVKTKRSLTNLFANQAAMISSLGIDTGENSRDANNSTGTLSGFRSTLRKVRSFSSVRSSSSTYSNEGTKKAPASAASSLNDEDRIITSADIDEPFPFGNFVQPQTPAMLFEDPDERQDNEDVRTALLEKARNERMAKWEQSEESKRKLEASRQKRRVLREEMDANVQATKNARQKHREENDQKRTKEDLIKTAPQTPNSALQSSGKPPKTPMKERVLKMIADSYSPTSPILD